MSGLIRLGWAAVSAGDDRRKVAWRLLREVVGNPGIRISNPCPRCGGDHGPVRIEGAAVTASVTYAGGWALVAVVPSHAGAVGVDAEPEDDERRERAGLAGVLGAGSATVRDWVRVEAALKADRRGLRVEPGTVRVTRGRDGGTDASAADTGAWHAHVPGRGGTIAGWDLAGPPGVFVSAAIARD